MEIKCKDKEHCKFWHKDLDTGYWHREDGPAYIGISSTSYYYEEWHYYNVRYTNSKDMPFNLFLAYCKWEYRKKHGN